MTNHEKLLIDYAATHLNVMSLKDPENLPAADVERATRRIKRLVFPIGPLDVAIFWLAVLLIGVLIGYAAACTTSCQF